MISQKYLSADWLMEHKLTFVTNMFLENSGHMILGDLLLSTKAVNNGIWKFQKFNWLKTTVFLIKSHTTYHGFFMEFCKWNIFVKIVDFPSDDDREVHNCETYLRC